MKFATENFEKFKERLGDELFQSLYKDELPKTFKVLDESESEICFEEEMEFVDGSKLLKFWRTKLEYIIQEI